MSEKPSQEFGQWESGAKRGEGAPERMGDWTTEDIEEASQSKKIDYGNNLSDNETLESDKSVIDLGDDAGMTRAEFIKTMATASAGIATLGAVGPKAVELIREIGEKDLQEKTETLRQRTIILKIPASYGIDHFYQRSGWNTGKDSIDAITYREIVKTINNLESSSLTAGAELEVPIREGNTLETSQ